MGFIYRSAANDAWNIWDTNRNDQPIGGDQWYHVALTYEFGEGDSMHVYVNGEEMIGTWTTGSTATMPPYQSNQPLWIGSQQGGSP